MKTQRTRKTSGTSYNTVTPVRSGRGAPPPKKIASQTSMSMGMCPECPRPKQSGKKNP